MITGDCQQFKGLYRGLSSPLYGLTFINAIVFGVYGNAIRVLGDEHNLKHEFLAGSVSQDYMCQSFY
jgi:solute carrier family 25 carnitine/acylcarnitine transporter 20/29